MSSGDASWSASLAAPGDRATASLLSAVVANAAALRVRDLTLRYVEESGAVAADGSWTGAVAVGWRFAGFDRVPVRAEVLVGFTPGPERVGIASIGGGEDRRTPLWLDGPLEVRRTGRTLVLVDGSAVDADAYAVRAQAAVPVVERVVTTWRPRLVVEVPGSVDALERTLATSPGTYDDIAAVAAPVEAAATAATAVHVYVNPSVFGALDPVGAQVVMSHEATHVATNAPYAPYTTMPLWLVEGFADYVALRDLDLPLAKTAGQIITQVAREGAPAALPGVEDFEALRRHLGAVYESAWLACGVVADQAGEDALVELYAEVDRGSDFPRTLRRLSGWSEAQLTTAWQQRLLAVAATTGAVSSPGV